MKRKLLQWGFFLADTGVRLQNISKRNLKPAVNGTASARSWMKCCNGVKGCNVEFKIFLDFIPRSPRLNQFARKSVSMKIFTLCLTTITCFWTFSNNNWTVRIGLSMEIYPSTVLNHSWTFCRTSRGWEESDYLESVIWFCCVKQPKAVKFPLIGPK